MAVSFIGGGNRSTRRKPPTCRKPLTNCITWCCIEYTWPRAEFELITLVVICTDCIDSCKSNYRTATHSQRGNNPNKITASRCLRYIDFYIAIDLDCIKLSFCFFILAVFLPHHFELTTDRWFSPGTPVSSTNKTDRHDITEILMKVALNTIKPTHRFELVFLNPIWWSYRYHD